jgi:hypothetical protein
MHHLSFHTADLYNKEKAIELLSEHPPFDKAGCIEPLDNKNISININGAMHELKQNFWKIFHNP